jgi:hypothetical protein
VAICNLAIVRSPTLDAAERLVNGVLSALPLVEPLGVDVEVEGSLALAACLAAFSANRFCFEADFGGIVVERKIQKAEKATSELGLLGLGLEVKSRGLRRESLDMGSEEKSAERI